MQGDCQYGQCNHSQHEHEEGVCWAITQPHLENQQTDEKYCPCATMGNIRRFDHPNMGFMPHRQNDHMVSKHCDGCYDVVLVRTDETKCQLCKTKEENEKRLEELRTLI